MIDNQPGLSSAKAQRVLADYGPNEIKSEPKASPLMMLLTQFTSPIILLLIGAAILSFSVNLIKHENFFDSILIILIVLAAGIAGFIQDYKAEEAVAALKRMATPKAKVIRDGAEQEIKATLIVPGDIIVVAGGDIIPADGTVIKGKLAIDESILTGESRANKKKRGENIFSGCAIYAGHAWAKVETTGMKTEVGKIAAQMEEIKTESTPFQNHMRKFTQKVVGLTALVIVITFAVGLKKFGVMEAALVAVSLAVAAIPEDLPAVVTIALSLGAREMVKRHALVRRLAITESIGSVQVICSDKTGTLTEGRMEVKTLWLMGESQTAADLAVKSCFYCNDAKQILDSGSKKWVGDETEIALKRFSLNKLEINGQRVDEVPFTSKRKMMSVVYDTGKKNVFSKGAPEVIITKSSRILKNGKVIDLNDQLINEILNKNKAYASQGYRVLALAYKPFQEPVEVENELIFIGLAVLADPPRPEAAAAIEDCYLAGIRTVMITGDNPLTAKAIADEVGIKSTGTLTGDKLDRLDEAGLKKSLAQGVNIYARTNPFHKLRILEVLQKEDLVVAMTGDGVNDALAIKKADVGTAMGIKGTEVAKEAGDIILLDDNFATIRNAIQEGRRIFDNIRKFVDYLLTCNVAEVVVVLLATIFMPFVSLYPVQILWINLITDGLPALALSIDPVRPGAMRRRPRPKNEGVINKKLALLIGGIGIKKSLVILATFFIVLPLGEAPARTTLFTGFIMYEFVRIGVIRYNEKLASLKDWLANKFLVYSLLVSLALQLLIIYSPLAKYFKVVPLGLFEWTILIGGTILGFILGIGIAWIIDKTTHEAY